MYAKTICLVASLFVCALMPVGCIGGSTLPGDEITLPQLEEYTITARAYYDKVGSFNPGKRREGVPPQETSITPNTLWLGHSEIYLEPNSICIEFDLGGLPTEATLAKIELYCKETGRNGVEEVSPQRIMDFWRLDPDFYKEEDGVRTHQTNCVTLFPLGYTLPPPTSGEWYSVDITELYNAWQAGIYPNHGVCLEAQVSDDGRHVFWGIGSEVPPEFLPRLKVTAWDDIPIVTLVLKMPLPGGKSWLLTTEAGGGDCAVDWIDPYHQDENFYSLDFAPWSKTDDITAREFDVPIYAAASGMVVVTEEDRPKEGNGYYVVLEHDYPYDGKLKTGFTTWYLHLKEPSTLEVGEKVFQGQQLGIMGDTGWRTGTHLHFGIRYNNDGRPEIQELSGVKMEGKYLVNYQTICAGTQRTGFYRSSNRLRE